MSYNGHMRKLIRTEKIAWYLKPQGVGKILGGYKTIYWLECIQCSKEFSIPEKRYNQGVGKYCSTKCSKTSMKLSGNPNWKGGEYAKFKVGPAKRKRLIRKANYTCSNCGFNKHKECLQIDHFKEVQHGGTTTNKNLKVVCANCHIYKTITGRYPS